MEDILPNDGQSFNPTNLSDEREEENLAEMAKAAQTYPIIDELIEATEAKLSDADSLSGLGIDSSMPTLQVQIITEGHKKYQALLISHLDWLKGLKDMFESR